MTTYRLMDGLSGRPGSGPASPSAYSGPFIAGLIWKVTANGLWLNGYYHWVPGTNGDTGARKFALHQLTDTGQGVQHALVPNSTVTSGTLTAGQWNFVPLATPIQLSGGVPYVAAYGYSAVQGFPDTQNQFGAGNPYSAGITNGPLFAYSDQGASAPEPFTTNYNQGIFSTGGTDPAATFPSTGDVHSNFWIDVQVSDTAPAGAQYRLFPSQPYPVNWVNDTANPFNLAVEFVTAKAGTVGQIGFYSEAGAIQLPTDVAIWTGLSGSPSIVPGSHLSSVSWSGAAGSGWVYATYPGGLALPAGDYKASVLNSSGTSIWNATTNTYWTTGPGASGITAGGGLSAPSAAAATGAQQSTYNPGTTETYPGTYAGVGSNYWVDVLWTPSASGSGLLMASFP